MGDVPSESGRDWPRVSNRVPVSCHAVACAISLLTGHEVLFGLVEMFDLNAEQNVPTLFHHDVVSAERGALCSTVAA